MEFIMSSEIALTEARSKLRAAGFENAGRATHDGRIGDESALRLTVSPDEDADEAKIRKIVAAVDPHSREVR